LPEALRGRDEALESPSDRRDWGRGHPGLP